MNMLNNKYLLATMIAKRVKELKAGAKPLVESKHKKFTMIALEEIKAGKVFIKEKKEPLKAEQIFNEDEKTAKVEEISDEVKEPKKSEKLSDGAKKPDKPEKLSDEVEKPAKIEEIFDGDKELGESEGLLNEE